jgi:hypothetical protein
MHDKARNVDPKHHGTAAKKTTLQKLNQGASRKRAVYRFRGSFFGSFLDKQKRTEQHFN